MAPGRSSFGKIEMFEEIPQGARRLCGVFSFAAGGLLRAAAGGRPSFLERRRAARPGRSPHGPTR